MSLGPLIKKKRTEMKVTQRQLASELGVSHGLVAQWELDQARPGPTLLPVVCEILGLDMRSDLSAEEQLSPQLVDDPKELALLGAFRIMDPEMRTAMLRVFIARLRDGRSSAA